MKSLAIVCTLGALALTSASARAGCHAQCDTCCPAPAPCPAPKPCVTYVEKTVTCYKPEWHEREEACTEDKITLRTETTTQKAIAKIPIFKDEKQVCTVYTKVARVVEHEETCCQMVTECVIDPCTGCKKTVCKPVTFVKKVQCTVWDTVPVNKEITVPVCTGFKEEVRTIECKNVVCEHHCEAVVKKVPFVVMVPYTTTVKVPVCEAAPACCP